MESDRDKGVEGLGVLGSGRVFMASVSDRKKRDVSGVFATVAAMMGRLDGMVDDEFERGMGGLLSPFALTPNRLRNLRIRMHPLRGMSFAKTYSQSCWKAVQGPQLTNVAEHGCRNAVGAQRQPSISGP